ncbi:MAG: AAA family ATPase [Treponema sp.]|nr:AAA family ATPase [Candidatus Treponema caballi]
MNTPSRRTLRHYMSKHRTSSSAITYTESEPWALCYYLYTMFENKSNRRIITTFDSAIRCFLGLVKMLDRTERLTKVLNLEIKNLEKRGLLRKLAEINPAMVYDCSEEFYVYEEDREIDRAMSRFDNADHNVINLHRILYVSEKPVFSSIVNTVIFKNGNSYALSFPLKMSKKVEKTVFDVEKTRFLIDQVNLSEAEARLILMKCRIHTIEYFSDIIRSSDNCDNKFHNRIADMLGISEKEYRQMLRNDGKLKSFGFLDDDGCYEETFNECIEEQSIEPWFSDMLKPFDCTNAYEPESFQINADSREIILDLLNGKNPVSILFYGKPGSGKTELAKTIAAKTDKKVFIFKNEMETCTRNNILGRLVCLLSMERPDSIIIVDEADSLLKTLDFSFFGTEPTKTKGTINKMLENNRDKVIYIINHQQQIDVSTLRRFTFSLKFEAMSATMLRNIAMSKLSALDLAEDTRLKLVDMFDRFHLTGASVDNVIKAIDGMQCRDEEILLKKAGIVMKENALLLNGKAKMRGTVRNEYDPRVLNTGTDAETILEMVQNAVRFAERNKGTENGIRMLFYGLSGTGKTEFARYLAEKLNKPVLLKRASDILDKYVGESEKKISDAFAEAESSGAVLLFDEADSFFSNRSSASKSWERTMVNEFLTQMEEFNGILICTTNLRNIMDPAMQRRFHIMVEFKPMNAAGIKTMAERYFPAWPLSNSQIKDLDGTGSVTPGDFGTLSSRIRFMNPDEITADYIFDELMKMQSEKKKSWSESGDISRPIGFTA